MKTNDSTDEATVTFITTIMFQKVTAKQAIALNAASAKESVRNIFRFAVFYKKWRKLLNKSRVEYEKNI